MSDVKIEDCPPDKLPDYARKGRTGRETQAKEYAPYGPAGRTAPPETDPTVLGRAAYEEFQRQAGNDPARLAWDRLDQKSRTQEKWIAIAMSVVKAGRK